MPLIKEVFFYWLLAYSWYQRFLTSMVSMYKGFNVPAVQYNKQYRGRWRSKTDTKQEILLLNGLLIAWKKVGGCPCIKILPRGIIHIQLAVQNYVKLWIVTTLSMTNSEQRNVGIVRRKTYSLRNIFGDSVERCAYGTNYGRPPTGSRFLKKEGNEIAIFNMVLIL